ncbi:hypothetical protein [Streptomyces sp. NRRL F-5123]|uniref:hypothetical protein n=1 Tax=Streptomyces sp. NRRL F-5123 TaxID=1463856 RepID=UPI0004E1E8F9|nr:hypothetical protein [Streptomyces sp. NRRL F-5123]
MVRVPKRWVALGTAAAAVTAAAALRSGGAAHGGSGADAAAGQQALAVARQEFGRLSGGDWAGAWQLWTADARQAVPQDEFVRANTECRPALGVPYVLGPGSRTGPGTFRVSWTHAGTTGSSTLQLASGHWYFSPGPQTLADFRLGADHVVRQRRASGSCR